MEKQTQDTYYSKKYMEKVLKSIDIVKIINDFSSVSENNGYYKCNCPFCKDNEKSLTISEESQAFECTQCGRTGDAASFIMDIKNISLTDAIEYLANKGNIEKGRLQNNTIGKFDYDSILKINKEALTFYADKLMSKSGEKGYNYLTQNRKIDDQTIQKFELGYASNRKDSLYQDLQNKGFDDKIIEKSGLVSFYDNKAYDKFRERIICPIIDTKNNIVGFSGRLIKDSPNQPKYINSPETQVYEKKENLFGLNLASKSPHDNIILCEGNLDVISMHQAGFTNTVASLGTALTKEQTQLLSNYTNQIYLTYDHDDAGTKAALRAIPMLNEQNLNVYVVDLSPYKDPDEFIKNRGEDNLQKRIDVAESSHKFEVRSITKNYNLNKEDSRQEAIDKVADKLLDVPKEDRQNYVKDLKEELDLCAYER